MNAVVVRVLSSRRAMCWIAGHGALLEVRLPADGASSWPPYVLATPCLPPLFFSTASSQPPPVVEVMLLPPFAWSPQDTALHVGSCTAILNNNNDGAVAQPHPHQAAITAAVLDEIPLPLFAIEGEDDEDVVFEQ